MAGWIKLYRDIQDHWIWQDANKLKWWLDIILMANHKENKFLLGNELFEVERGEFHTSELKLMERWNVSKTTIRRFLELLERDQMIVLKKTKKGTTIKVNNYSAYQDISEVEKTIKEPRGIPQKNHKETTEEPQRDHKETIKEPQRDHTVYTNKNEKNDKNEKECIKNEKNDKKEKKETIRNVLDAYASSDSELYKVILRFIEMRKTIKKDMTAYALKLRLKKLDELASDEYTKIKILEQSIANSWQDIFPLKNNTQYSNRASNVHGIDQKFEGINNWINGGSPSE